MPSERTPLTAPRPNPRRAVLVLLAVIAIAVAASVPVTRHARTAHQDAAAVARLTDLINRERKASVTVLLTAPSAAFGANGLTLEPDVDHGLRHDQILQLVERLDGRLPDGLAAGITEFLALVDGQVSGVAAGRLPDVIELERTRIQPAYRALAAQLDSTAALSVADAAAADAWESILLFGIALAATIVVVGLFVVLQRRSAALEYSAGRRAALEEEQHRLRALIASSSDVIAVLGDDDRLRWGSPSMSQLLGVPEDRLVGTDPLHLVHPDDRAGLMARLDELRRAGDGPVRTEVRVLRRPDQEREGWLELVMADGRSIPGIGGVIVNGRDVTEQHRTRAALEARARDLRDLMNHVSGVFYRAEAGPSGRWSFVSPQIEQLLGYTPEEWLADPGLWLRSIHPDDRERVLREDATGDGGVIDYRMITRTGEVRWVRDDAAPLPATGSEPAVWAGTLIDVTRAYLVEEELRYRAHHDALTGLPNRSLLLDRLGNALDRSRRKPTDVGLIYLDLDDFKRINDEHGHASGDALLVALAQRLRDAIRPGDTAARLGGDEFALLVDEIDRAGLTVVADRVIGALDTPLDLGGHQVHVTGSVGVAISLGAGTDPERMLRDADTAMYVAKRRGKHRWVFYDPGMSGPLRERVRMESDLRRALEHGEFHLVYHPIVRLVDGRIEGAEALLRWQSPEAGALHPDEFLDIAEDSGLLVQIGRWVLRQACRDAAMWQRTARRGIWLGVNLSARQLLDPGIVASVRDSLAESGLPAHQLVLEVNENAALRDLDAAEQHLAHLKALGLRLAIDDFGSGTSSIGHLRRLAFDVIKIDRSLVADVEHSTESQDLVRSIVHIGRTLRAVPLAEGVEAAAQVGALRAAGCELGQGYLFARPMDAATLREAFLTRGSNAHAG